MYASFGFVKLQSNNMLKYDKTSGQGFTDHDRGSISQSSHEMSEF